MQGPLGARIIGMAVCIGPFWGVIVVITTWAYRWQHSFIKKEKLLLNLLRLFF